MIGMQNTKFVKVYDSVSIGAATASVATIDTKGFHYCSIYFYGGVVHSVTTLQIKESDTDGSFAAFSNENGVFGFGETSQLNVDGTTAADPSSGVNSVAYGFQIDLLDRKRYLETVITTGGTSVIAAFAILSRPSDLGSPDTLANIGLTGCIRA